MEITSHFSWRRSHSSYFCDSNRLAKSGTIFSSSGLRISCQYGCSASAISLPHYCIEYSVEDDWTYLEGHRAYNFSFNGTTATIGNVGYAWVAPFNNAHWNISTTFSQITRPDTGQINSSPRVASFPYVYIQWRYFFTTAIPLAVSDPDNDIIRCRWAVGAECREVCNNFTGASLDSASCTIWYYDHYYLFHETKLHLAAIMVEDFLPGSSVPLSSVAHQFLVKVVDVNSSSCYTLPRFISPTLSQGTCINIPPGTIFTRQLIATSGCSGVTITAIKIIAPNGTSKGELCHVLGTNKYSTNITWTPSVSQQNDTHFLCYVAVSSNNLTSEQYCMKLAAYHPPMPLSETATPNNLFYSSSNATLQIMFDRKIQRPSTSAFIKFYKFGEVVHHIDTSSSSEVKFHGQNLTIISNYSFVEGIMYYVNFDEGVVTSIEGCHLSNEPIHSETFWNFQMINLTPS